MAQRPTTGFVFALRCCDLNRNGQLQYTSAHVTLSMPCFPYKKLGLHQLAVLRWVGFEA